MNRSIPFNKPAVVGSELAYISDAIARGKLAGDGYYTKRAHQWLEERYPGARALLTTSCTDALEMAALLLNLQPGDEVIVHSYTFVSTANAFALRGARLVFVDIEPRTMNLDPRLVSEAVTPATKAVVAVRYAGTSCAIDELAMLCLSCGIALVEDAAQAIGTSYRGRPLGTFGTYAALSFHETKNLHCGEGGALLINAPQLADRAEIVREKGTDRSRFFRGQVDKYSWQTLGSSFLPSELSAAFLVGQFEAFDRIQEDRCRQWKRYDDGLKSLALQGRLEQPHVPAESTLNAHMYWIKVRDFEAQGELISALKLKGITAVFHYLPLHSSPEGLRSGRFSGEDRWTTREASRLVRLPLYYGFPPEEQDYVIESVRSLL